jgi:hypothetical protein
MEPATEGMCQVKFKVPATEQNEVVAFVQGLTKESVE